MTCSPINIFSGIKIGHSTLPFILWASFRSHFKVEFFLLALVLLDRIRQVYHFACAPVLSSRVESGPDRVVSLNDILLLLLSHGLFTSLLDCLLAATHFLESDLVVSLLHFQEFLLGHAQIRMVTWQGDMLIALERVLLWDAVAVHTLEDHVLHAILLFGS
jgi:hypothetical protein